jgi:cell wall-associated NlpC family hydrolase
MKQLEPQDFDTYVGIPWKTNGRDRNGLDCWGLGYLVYRELLGIELPSYSAEYTSAMDRKTIRELVSGRPPDNWVKVGDPQPGDGVLLHAFNGAHMGVVVGGGRMLHIQEGSSSCIESYTSLKIAHNIEGFYRYIQ